MQEKKEIYAEIRGIFADAAEGRDLENIEGRLSIAATKLDALNDYKCKGIIEAIDAVRKGIGKDPDKARYHIKALTSLLRDDTSGAQEALDELQVHTLVSTPSQGV